MSRGDQIAQATPLLIHDSALSIQRPPEATPDVRAKSPPRRHWPTAARPN